jgi:hypothetical protein
LSFGAIFSGLLESELQGLPLLLLLNPKRAVDLMQAQLEHVEEEEIEFEHQERLGHKYSAYKQEARQDFKHATEVTNE